ncbi:MAG: hypothetical protein ABI208_07935 [Ginsengibacter sp.]|jgi:hypothetical protein
MKKLLIIPITFLVAGIIFLSSCGNTSSDRSMKAPVQNNTDTTIQKENKKSDEKIEKEKEEKEEKKHKKNKKDSIAEPANYTTLNEANTKMIYETQAALWL